MFRLFVLMAVFMSGCSGTRESLNKWAAGPETTTGEPIPETEKRAESPIIDSGKDYDRLSGVMYTWNARENGTIQIIAMLSDGYASFTFNSDGKLISIYPDKSWTYDASKDLCVSSSGDPLLGLPCIHPVVSDFFAKHEFDPPHPLYSRSIR